MKRNLLIPLFTFACFLHLSIFAAVPLRWTVETSRAVPATFEAYQGETLNFEAALTSYGKPLEAPSNYSFFWQTNGMGNAWWEVPCHPPSTSTSNLNLMVATWSPTNDVGARVYNCFIGQPGTIYHAAFQLRLRPSPGATPNELPLPVPVIDFAKVKVLNPPWSGGGGGVVDTNAVEQISNTAVETNAVTVGLQSSVSSLQSSKADKSTTYTKSETDERLAGKANKNGDGSEPFVANSVTAGDFFIPSGQSLITVNDRVSVIERDIITKADRPSSYAPGNLAKLDVNGNPVDSGKTVDDFLPITGGSLTGPLSVDGNISVNGVINAISLGDTPVLDGAGTVIGIVKVLTDGMLANPSTADAEGSPADAKLTRDFVNGKISATDPTFSNAVLQTVIPNLPTNITAEVYIAATNACANLGIDPALIPQGGTLGTVGGLLVALAAAVALLRKKTSLLKSDGTSEDDFATDLLGKSVANAKMRYALATTASAAIADRTVNLYEMNGNGTITFPTATTHEGVTYARDFLLRVKVTTVGSLTLPTDVTPLGDSFDFTKANDWLIAFTEIGKDANNKAEFYIRAISLEG